MEPITSSQCVRPNSAPPSRGFRRSWMLLSAVLLAAISAGSASAQVIPGLVLRSDVSVFGTLPANLTPDFAPIDSPVLFGYSLGGFYQSRHIIGAEIRGSIQRRINVQHQESALAGPRAALHFGRITPYTCFLFGAGNGWRFKESPPPGQKIPKPIEGLGPQWTLVGGADLHLTRHVAIRVGEISYSKLYLKDWDLTPLNFTAGVVWRLR